MNTAASDRSVVQINRLKDSWTWVVVVEADGNVLDQLREAKKKALHIVIELQQDLRKEPLSEALIDYSNF